MRLDKFLCECQLGTRSEVKKYIKQGSVQINGQVAAKPEQKVDENTDVISFKGKALRYQKNIYYVLNKKKDCVTAVCDSYHKTVMDDFPPELRKRLTPVGRLDLDTQGLLLLTDDGAFTHHILSPSHHMPKTYEATLDALVPPEAKELFEKGIDIGDEDLTLPAQLEVLEDGFRARLTITEGRFHQVKRMFAAVGCQVVELTRLSIGGLTLEGLQVGEYRELTADEVAMLSE